MTPFKSAREFAQALADGKKLVKIPEGTFVTLDQDGCLRDASGGYYAADVFRFAYYALAPEPPQVVEFEAEWMLNNESDWFYPIPENGLRQHVQRLAGKRWRIVATEVKG
ncbi:MAG: hypothetical protein KF767_08760 [Bdellovibrionaceae bacterium]|nr:hypothetical protein [Pseudobdellovibrionaceae bacterium]